MSKADESNRDSFIKERRLLRKLVHPNILRLRDCYMDNQCYYIATEYCSGGTMLDKVIRMKNFTEKRASQNVIFSKPGSKGVLQVIDFGESELLEDGKMYN